MQFQCKQFLILLFCPKVWWIKIKECRWTVIQSDDDLKTFILYDHAFARISASHQNLTVTLHAVFIQPAVGKPYGAVCLGDIYRLTLEAVCCMLQQHKPASIKTAVMCDKADRRVNGKSADYVGFCIPDEFAVGYGLDYAGNYRNLPYIGVLKPCVYART